MDETKKLEDVVGMRFASQEFFERLKNGLQDEKLKDWTYAELYFVLQRDTKYKIINRVGYSNWEDVFQNVVSAVIRQLSSFILNPKSLIEANRQAWLNTIVRGESVSWTVKNIDWHVSLEQLYEEGELSHELIKSVRESNIEENPEAIYMDREISIEFQNKLKELYSLNSSPERLISYTYSKLIIPQWMGNGYSGKPSETRKYLNGKRLDEIFEYIVIDLKAAMHANIPMQVFLPLIKKLDAIDNDGCSKGKCRFTLSVKQITQATNRISEKACMIFSENGESNEPSR